VTTDILTVEAAADFLHLHPKTVLRHVREGRLRATKVGKQYRLLRSDLAAFAGIDRNADSRQARATSIVDVEDAGQAMVDRLSAVLLGAAKGRDASQPPMSLDIVHDPDRRTVKVVIIASPADAAACLRLVTTCLEG
jgi:excisionase family DNA binding protein